MELENVIEIVDTFEVSYQEVRILADGTIVE